MSIRIHFSVLGVLPNNVSSNYILNFKIMSNVSDFILFFSRSNVLHFSYFILPIEDHGKIIADNIES